MVEQFIHSSVAKELIDIVTELEGYLEGGSDYEHKFLREAMDIFRNLQPRKIKVYLHGILEDAQQYSDDKKPGRKKGTKNRKKVSK